jgi:hypothetical protein
MAIDPGARYTGKITAPSASYPYGSAQDITTPGDGTGTPWEQNLLNDIWGLLQKMLGVAELTPSDLPDTVLVSQYYQALIKILGTSTTYVFADTTDLAAGTTILGESVVFKEGQALKIQATDRSVRFFVVTTSSTSPNISLGGGLYARERTPRGITGTFDAEVRTPFADVLDVETWKYIKMGNLITLTIPSGGHLVNSTANDFFEVSPPAGTGVWPSDIVPASGTLATVMVEAEAAPRERRLGELVITNNASSNFIGWITDSSAILQDSGWGFNAANPKGLVAQSFIYRTD